jgi:hypothetical protein
VKICSCRLALYRRGAGSRRDVALRAWSLELHARPWIDPQMSDQTAAASAAREMLCLFTPARNGPDEARAGALRSINAGKMLPDNVALLWKVRAPVGKRVSPGLLEQSYAGDPATPPGQTAPLVGERNNHITLHTMSETVEGTASKDRRPTRRFIPMTIELKLKGAMS